MNISELFKPLSNLEQSSIKDCVLRLIENKDFQLFVRDCFNKAPPLTPSFLTREGDNTITAAKREGEKNISRYILQLLITKDEEPIEKPTSQIDNDTL
jgi:hypothetical protein